MRKLGWALAVAGLWLGGWVAKLPAASSTVFRGGVSYTLDGWATEDGLPQKSIIAMTQSRDGYLWLGTLRGLARFDGTQFTVFDENKTPGLPSSQIVSLFEDVHSRLWIGTRSAGIVLLQEGELIPMEVGRGAFEKRLVAACEDLAGMVWLYTANGELWRYRNGRLDPGVVDQGRASGSRFMIAEPDGPVWVGMDWGQSALALHADPGSIEVPVKQFLPANSRLHFLAASPRGGYWRLADGRVQRWSTNRLERDLGPYQWDPVHTPVRAACEDRLGNLVIGTQGAGLFWYDPEGRVTKLSTNDLFPDNYILSLLVDREGALWVGTDGSGLFRLKLQAFEVLADCRGWVVQSVCEDSEGGLWIGANGGQLGYWRGGVMQRFGLLPGLFVPSVRSVLAGQGQDVWVGTLRAGLFQLQNQLFRPVPSAVVGNPDVFASFQDRSGTLWVGTQGGLARWDGNAWRMFTKRDGLSADEIRAIAADAEGYLWIGTEGGGLNRLRLADNQVTVFGKKDGLPSENISSLWIDAEGVVWIGTDGSGLARFHRNQWTCYTSREGLASDGIGYMLEDGQGYLWVGSAAGLMRLAKKALNDFATGLTRMVPCRAYGKPDGLPDPECTAGSQPGGWRSRDGTLWFPTVKGLASLNPARITPNTNPPPVVIESVLIDDQPQNTNTLRTGWPRAVTVPAGGERVDIHYTSLNLAAPDRARFRYRLAGHETAWTEAGNIRIAHYSKLPPGEYRFQVIACNEDGLWNDTGSTLALTVEPPFWRTWWFLTATTGGFLGAIIAIVHYVSTQKLQRQLESMRQKEALERERARIARDLHDQLGANLTQVSLLGEMVESDKDLPDEVESHARQISQTARETTRALDEIVWAANPANDTLEGLINYCCKYAQEYFALADIRYRLEVPPQLPDTAISPDLRHNVFLAFKEAVNNVVKHARASSARVRMKLEPFAFTLEVQDDGRGLAGADEKKGRNGLRNMRRRMEDVGGSFTIEPVPEKGALVRLTAPIRSR